MGKCDALERGNFLGLKLTYQVMKLLERVLNSFIREIVDHDSMQFGFVPGRGTTDSIFIIHQIAGEVHCCQQATLLRLCLSGEDFRQCTQESSLVGLEEFWS